MVAEAKAKSVTNNLPILTVLAVRASFNAGICHAEMEHKNNLSGYWDLSFEIGGTGWKALRKPEIIF